MKKTENVFILVTFFISFLVLSPAIAETDLPMSEKIKILKVTPYGEETKSAFEVTPKDSSYESFFNAILGRIREGYKPDCGCELDNDYFISLENREVYKTSWPFIRNMAAPEMMCSFVFSKNRRYTGLIFYLGGMEVYAHHFVMVNSKGELLWEMKPKDYKTYGKCAQGTGFPNDEGDYGARHWFVSNDGKLLMMTAAGWFDDEGGIRSYSMGVKMKKGWMLYGSDGKVIAEQPFWCREAAFSNDGSFFVVQEMRDSDSRKYDDEAGTSCYDEEGKLLWHKKDIIPIIGPSYFVSPSNNYILACLKKKKIYDVCVLNRKGKVVAKAGLPYDERSSSNDFYPAWTPDEKRLFWGGGVMNFDFSESKTLEPVTTFTQIAKRLREDYGRLRFRTLVPLNDKYLIGVGDRASGFGKSFEPKGKYRVLGIFDEFKLVGIKFLETGTNTDLNYRVFVDRAIGKVYTHTNDVFFCAEIDLKGDKQ